MFKSIFKNLISFNPATIFIAIFLVIITLVTIPNFSKIASVFGYETRTVLKEKLTVANQSVETAVNVIKQNNVTVRILEETVKNTEEVIVAKVTQDKKVEKHYTEVKEKKAKVIETIQTSSKSKEVQEQETSEVQIASLWDNYCQFNNNGQCAAQTTHTPGA